ncbi:alcohol dehydrogenase [Hymenopellis radicata]|nr:alcohol dehydrogenase [Hymenopellis radicata]
MAPVTNAAVLFNEVPTGYPEPGKTTVYDSTQTIDLNSVALNGGILVKTLVVSVDPYQRGKMREPNTKSYAIYGLIVIRKPPYFAGEPLYNYGIGRVLRSDHSDFKVDDHVTGQLNFQEYSVFPAEAIPTRRIETIIKTAEALPWTAYVGAAGMPGRTAFFGYKEFAKAKKGDTIFVTTGAGAVGSMVVQLAKLDGLKVIASTGSDAKVEFLKEIGADVAFNYKTTDTLEVLEREGPLDIYWDNVGGSILDAALGCTKNFARVIACGMITGYNDGFTGQNFKNLWLMFARSLFINGFLEFNLRPQWMAEFNNSIPQKLASGEIKYRQEITHGLEGAGLAIRNIQLGDNVGKSVVVVAHE